MNQAFVSQISCFRPVVWWQGEVSGLVPVRRLAVRFGGPLGVLSSRMPGLGGAPVAPLPFCLMGLQGGASRERMVMDTLVELADTLAGDYDIDELLHFLVDRCGRALSADTAGVLLEAPGGGLQLAAATSDEMREIEDAEITTGKGPCIEAYARVSP